MQHNETMKSKIFERSVILLFVKIMEVKQTKGMSETETQ